MRKIVISGFALILSFTLSGCSSSVSLKDEFSYKDVSLSISDAWSENSEASDALGFKAYSNNEKCILIDKINNTPRVLNSPDAAEITDFELLNTDNTDYKIGYRNFIFKNKDKDISVELGTLYVQKYPFNFINEESNMFSIIRIFKSNDGLNNIVKSVEVEVHCPSSVNIEDSVNSISFIY